MEHLDDSGEVLALRRDQILKLVAKGFFNELVNYGFRKEEIMRLTSHLLDNLLVQHEPSAGGRSEAELALNPDSVTDEWQTRRQLLVGDVTLRPLDHAILPRLCQWLQAPAVRDAFVPAFPDTEAGLRRYFDRPGLDYFGIHHHGDPVGIVGGELIDRSSGKLEMKKLVGELDRQSKGIGKRATFGFLYYAFVILGMHKVYVHSRDINVRNLNLNSRFGFELEGVFFEDAWLGDRRVDVLRMALLKPMWSALHGFSDH